MSLHNNSFKEKRFVSVDSKFYRPCDYSRLKFLLYNFCILPYIFLKIFIFSFPLVVEMPTSVLYTIYLTRNFFDHHAVFLGSVKILIKNFVAELYLVSFLSRDRPHERELDPELFKNCFPFRRVRYTTKKYHQARM